MANQTIGGLTSEVTPRPATSYVTDERFTRLNERGNFDYAPRDKALMAMAGDYFVATNPTAGTAIAAAVLTALDDTKAHFCWTHKDGPGAEPKVQIVPDYLRLIPTVAPASATQMFYTLVIEPGSAAAPSAGNNNQTPVNANSGESRSSKCRFDHFTGGAAMTMVARTAQARTLVTRGLLRRSVPVVNDEIILDFANLNIVGSLQEIATISKAMTGTPPISIGPGGQLRLYLWWPGNSITGMSLEFDTGWAERPL